MRPKQLTKLSEEIKHGYKFLRACHYDAKSKRLELTLGTDVHDGFARLVNIEAATEPPDLAKWTGHEIYGIRFYHRLDRAEDPNQILDRRLLSMFTMNLKPSHRERKQKRDKLSSKPLWKWRWIAAPESASAGGSAKASTG